jgi:hypothetical protein
MTTNVQITHEEVNEPTRTARLMQTLAAYTTVSNLLRVLGAGVLITSVTMFLFKGWSTGNDIEKYLMLLAHTVILAITGVAVGRWLKESKGARLFLSLSLVSAVINFAVLGGLIYSQVQWDNGLGLYPSFARWQADSLSGALGISALAWFALAPVALFSFMALARRSSLHLALLFMLSCTTLLVPIRQVEVVAVLCVGLVELLIHQVIQAKRHNPSLATHEGRFARLILFLAPCILIGRGIYLYSADVLMLTVIAGIVFMAIRQLSMDAQLSDRARRWINVLSVPPAIVTAGGMAYTLFDAGWIDMAAGLPIASVVLAALCIDLALRHPANSGYQRLANHVLAIGMLANLCLFPSIGTAVVCLVSGIVVVVHSYTISHRGGFFTGLAGLLAGGGYQCYLAFEVFDFTSWSALAIMGVLAIVAGSVLERHGPVIRARLQNLHRSLNRAET